MRKILTLIVAMMFLMVIIPLGLNENVGAATSTIYATASNSGHMYSYDADYSKALDGLDHTVQTNHATATIGQISGANWGVFRIYLSFDTSGISANEEIISSNLNVRFMTDGSLTDFDADVYNIEYGATLTAADWNVTGTYEGPLFNSSEFSSGHWTDMYTSTGGINKTGNTQYLLKASIEGSAVATYIHMAGASLTPPFLTIVTQSPTGMTITYNISTASEIPKTMNITYIKKHNDEAHLHETWENVSFIKNNWQTTGTPIIVDWATPYEGSYSAGGMVNVSGTGTHTFEIASSTNAHQWVNIDYARKSTDAGQGTPELNIDWWDGNGWNNIEYIAGTNAWARNTANLSTLGADNNENFILRFSIGFPAPQNNGNAVWVDDIWINSTQILNVDHCDFFIHPAEIQDYNLTHELLRYEVFTSDLLESVNMTVNSSLVYSTIIPCWPMNSGEYGGMKYYNVSGSWIDRFAEVYTNIWFFLAKYDSTSVTSETLYPVEIIDWNNTHEQLRFSVFSHGDWVNMTIDINYTYQSASPNCTITDDHGAGIYNITNTMEDTFYHVWFLREKALIQTNIHISMSDANIGEGFFWEKWRVMISPGTYYDNTSASRITNSEYKVTYGNNYTIAITDFFDPPNEITNYSFVANALDMDINIPIPAYPVTIYNEKSTFTEFRIYYNASGNPYNEFISPGKERVVYMRTGTYMFVFQYYTALGNYSIAPGNAYYFNYTIDGAYGIHLAGTNIATIYSQVNGLEQIFNQFNMALISPEFWAMDNLPVVPVDGTRSLTEPSYQNGVLLHPYAVIEADIQNSMNGTSGSFFDPSPTAGTTTILTDELYIAGNYSTNIQLNLSNGWRFLNLTTAPGLIDLTAYNDTANITYWTNDSINIVRKTTIRNSGLFYWTYYPTTKLYITSQTLNNTTDFDWTDISYFVSFVPESEGGEPADLNTVTVYDQNNTVYLVLGQHYLSTTGGIAMDFDRLNATDSRAFTFRYYADNGTNEKTEIITVSPPYYLRDWFNADYYYGIGTWQNQYSSTFQGDIQIKIVDAGGIIDPDTVWVKDVTNDRVLDKNGIEYTFSGNTIMINYKAVGDIDQGGSVQYEVYFQLSEQGDTEASWMFEGPWSPISILIALGGVLMLIGGALMLVLKKKKEGGGILALGLVMFMFFGIMSLIHRIGGIG